MNKIENKKQHVACVCIISTTYSHAAPGHMRPPVYIEEEAEEELICTFFILHCLFSVTDKTASEITATVLGGC